MNVHSRREVIWYLEQLRSSSSHPRVPLLSSLGDDPTPTENAIFYLSKMPKEAAVELIRTSLLRKVSKTIHELQTTIQHPEFLEKDLIERVQAESEIEALIRENENMNLIVEKNQNSLTSFSHFPSSIRSSHVPPGFEGTQPGLFR
jgi:hypothetical protein